MATLVGLQYLQNQEQKRSNQAQEALKSQELKDKVAIAEADRKSREGIADLDRGSRESVSAQERQMKVMLSELDRESNEKINAERLESNERIADKDRVQKDQSQRAERSIAREKLRIEDARYDKDRESREKISEAQLRNSAVTSLAQLYAGFGRTDKAANVASDLAGYSRPTTGDSMLDNASYALSALLPKTSIKLGG